MQVVNTCVLGEGPHWDGTKQELFYVDIEGTSVNRYNPVTNDHARVTIGKQWELQDLIVRTLHFHVASLFCHLG